MFNIHGTCVAIEDKGVLLLGDSGSGKSDIALRLIELHRAKLVADDRVDIKIADNRIIASCPRPIENLLEVRGLGLVKYPSQKNVDIKLVIRLTDKNLERMPSEQFYTFGQTEIPLFCLNPQEISATAKIMAAIRLL